MNAFNRIFLGIYSLLWIGACAGVISLAWAEDEKLDFNLGDTNVQAFVISDGTDRWIVTAIVALLGLIGLITLLTAFRRGSRGTKGFVRLKAADGGVVEVSASAIEAILRTEIEGIPQVRQASTIVRVKGGVIEPDITASIDHGASIAGLTQDISERTAGVLREQVGASRVRRPVLHLTYDQIAARPAGHARPPAPIAPPPEGDLPPPPPLSDRPPPSMPTTPLPPISAADQLPQPPRSSQEPPAVITSPTVAAWEPPPPPPPSPDGDEPGDTPTEEIPPREFERRD